MPNRRYPEATVLPVHFEDRSGAEFERLRLAMSYVVQFDDDRVWSGANWVFRELLRRTEPLLAGGGVPSLQALLHSPRVDALKMLTLSDVPLNELTALLEVVQTELADTERAGPSSFASPEFFPGFVERICEFGHLLAGHIQAQGSRGQDPS